MGWIGAVAGAAKGQSDKNKQKYAQTLAEEQSRRNLAMQNSKAGLAMGNGQLVEAGQMPNIAGGGSGPDMQGIYNAIKSFKGTGNGISGIDTTPGTGAAGVWQNGAMTTIPQSGGGGK
jgi:hypothetical protein